MAIADELAWRTLEELHGAVHPFLEPVLSGSEHRSVRSRGAWRWIRGY